MVVTGTRGILNRMEGFAHFRLERTAPLVARLSFTPAAFARRCARAAASHGPGAEARGPGAAPV